MEIVHDGMSMYYVHNFFVYTKKFERNNKIYLRCRKRKCPGSASISNDEFKVNSQHNHTPFLSEVDQIKFVKDLKDASSSSLRPYRELFNDAKMVYSNCAESLTYKQLMQRMYYARKKVIPPQAADELKNGNKENRKDNPCENGIGGESIPDRNFNQRMFDARKEVIPESLPAENLRNRNADANQHDNYDKEQTGVRSFQDRNLDQLMFDAQKEVISKSFSTEELQNRNEEVKQEDNPDEDLTENDFSHHEELGEDSNTWPSTANTKTTNNRSPSPEAEVLIKPQPQIPINPINDTSRISSQLMAYIMEKRQRKREKKSNSGDVHPVDTFLNSLAPTLKTLNPTFLNKAKTQIFNIVQEMEMMQLQGRQSEVDPLQRANTETRLPTQAASIPAFSAHQFPYTLGTHMHW